MYVRELMRFDSRGAIHKELVPEGRTINAPFCLEVLEQLLQRI
jgi:hypothetical protein